MRRSCPAQLEARGTTSTRRPRRPLPTPWQYGRSDFRGTIGRAATRDSTRATRAGLGTEVSERRAKGERERESYNNNTTTLSNYTTTPSLHHQRIRDYDNNNSRMSKRRVRWIAELAKRVREVWAVSRRQPDSVRHALDASTMRRPHTGRRLPARAWADAAREARLPALLGAARRAGVGRLVTRASWEALHGDGAACCWRVTAVRLDYTASDMDHGKAWGVLTFQGEVCSAVAQIYTRAQPVLFICFWARLRTRPARSTRPCTTTGGSSRGTRRRPSWRDASRPPRRRTRAPGWSPSRRCCEPWSSRALPRRVASRASRCSISVW
ncbi:small ribosomal subunit protein mS34 isoform X1 [Petromyzon marinus]|uniref:small ribosomal subunit protein mS34 isoform X1 n=1 Tax=Petromyzon marinus TaxID=7757 RepID=UPI003F73035D